MARRNRDTAVLRLEVDTPAGWVDVLGPTSAITLQRNANLEAGILAASIHDVTLDPSKAPTLRAGATARLMVEGLAGWRPCGTFTTTTAKTTYARPGGARKPSKRATIALAAEDVVPVLATKAEARSVATVDELRRLLATAGVPFRVNGTTGAGPAEPVVVAVSDEASLADQVATTRDTVQGYAHVAADGVLEVWDRASMPTAPVAVWTDTLESGLSYSDLALTYDSTDVLDEVTVEFLRYKPVTSPGQVEVVTYGPYRRAGATGSNATTVRYVSTVEDEAEIEAFAQEILDRISEPQMRPESMTVLVRSAQERDAVADMEPDALVRVRSYADDLDVLVRIDSLEHTIEVVNRQEFRWSVTFTFDPPERATRRPLDVQQVPVRAPAVLERIESVETQADATELVAQSAEDRATGVKESETKTSLDGARVHSDRDAQGRGRLRWFADDGVTVIGMIRGIYDAATDRLIFGIAGGDQSNPARIRPWTYLLDGAIRRRIDLICDEIQANGLLQATNGITVQLGPAVMKGWNSRTGVERVTSSTGTTTLPHLVSGGGFLVPVPQPGGEGFDAVAPWQYYMSRGSVTGTEVTFQARWNPGVPGRTAGEPLVNERIAFGFAIFSHEQSGAA